MNIAIVGASGKVGREILKILIQKGIANNNSIDCFASAKSKGIIIQEKNFQYIIKELNENNLRDNYDFALFSAGSEISKIWYKKFIERGAYVIDNSSAFRRCYPLIIPEINLGEIKDSKLIANPNCSTIGVCLPLFALSKKYKIKRVIISTYQAVSGAGQKGVDDLIFKTTKKFPYIIENNLIPQIDKPMSNLYTFEEDKMEYEIKKILNNQDLKICATCVRVPILNCHSESVNVEFETVPDLNEIKNLLQQFNGIKVIDDLYNNLYPMPKIANNKDDVFVGRIRKDTSCHKAINFFICFDNIRKGASLNAVQILQNLM